MHHIHIHFGHAVTPLPALSRELLDRAGADDLRLLVTLCTYGTPMAAGDLDTLCTILAETTGYSTAVVAASIAFWRGAGILTVDEIDMSSSEKVTAPSARPSAAASTRPVTATQPVAVSQPVAPAQPVVLPPAPLQEKAETIPSTAAPSTAEKKTAPADHVMVCRAAADHLPRYTTTEIADILSARKEISQNIDECNRIWGKILNAQEINTLLGLSDYLGLDWDYILSLMARLAADLDAQGAPRSMRIVEKRALDYYDAGIRTLDALQEKFRALDLFRSTEGRLRTLFGMGDRRLTPSETKYFSTWLYDFRYDMEIIEMAYNVTVDTKGTPKMSYINSVLANWNADNLRTSAEIQAAQEKFRAEQDRIRAEKNGKKKPGTTPAAPPASFDTEDFFDAAVRRSLGDDFTGE